MSSIGTSSQETAKDFIADIIEKLQAQRGNKFIFLLVGRTGVGKSSTINSLMGTEIAKVGDYEPTTMEIKPYNSDIKGVNFTVIDTPGLCDDIEEAGNDYKYLELMRSNVSQVDSMWFVSRLDETRVTSDEKRGIKLISEAFKSTIWQNAVIVFTFAGNIDASKYELALKKRTELIRNEIAKYTGIGIANNIPSVAVDNKSETTPDGEKWLAELYTQVYARMSAKGAAPFLMATVERVKPPKKEKEVVKEVIYVPTPVRNPDPEETAKYSRPIELNDRQAEIVRNKTSDVLQFTVAGASVGAAFGAIAGPAGAAIGGAIGGVIGFFGGLFGK
ncbi:MAG: 50S ribosome-binding GTPase [Mojavia pulchra JT2-VF2]|jgi:small GTP-binding protein|uniref:50S ribosome-binding GTPase n=1 Tax=Mojavia pulchra JT2-VF2 TaxID=287848 RepID=A0A951Q1I1_9NOST|nr:50S ribosome-binding GTPase [Mojavia pulchra JT2-VF2]